jgi:hypothetical protein
MDDEDEYLCAFLDYQGGSTSSKAGIIHNCHNFGASLGSIARSIRLRSNKGRHHELC